MPEENIVDPVVIETKPKHRFAKSIIALAIFILLGSIAFAAYSFGSIRDILKRGEKIADIVKEKPTPISDNRIKNRQSTEKLSPEEYESEAAYYVTIMQIKDPRESLVEMRKNVENDPALLRSCHPITHEIGRKAYDKYLDFNKAMEYLDEICNTGYMHGVIEGKFSTSPNVYTELTTICNDHDESRCFHGVGHGVMFYTENDLPKSLSMCEIASPKLSSQLSCAEGVFMENFNTDQKTHPSKYMSDTDLFYPCQTQKEKYKYPCYYYAPLHFFALNPLDYEYGLNWCNAAEANFVVHCIRGVAAVAIKQNISTPKKVETACMSAETKQIPYCIDGMVGLYLNHYNSLDKAYQLCDLLLESNKNTCVASVKSRENGFQSEIQGATINKNLIQL